MINYKQLITDFASIAYHHEQIRSFGFGDLPQITNDIETDQEPLYTKMYIVPGNIVFNQNQITYELNLIILDKINIDLSNLTEVMSDTLEIQKDIWTILYQSYTNQFGNFSWYILPDDFPTVTPFLEKYETILGGWTMSLNVYIPFDYNRCSPPVIDNFQFPQEEPFKSYKLILNNLEEFAGLHEQIKSYGYGDIAQLTNDIITKQEPLYPRMYVNSDVAKFKSGQIEYSFNVYVIDRLTIDLSNQQDVLSDTLEILKDLYAKLYLSDFSAEWNAQLQPFYEATETGVSGWILNLTSLQKSDYDRCVLPTIPFNISRTPVWIPYTNYSDSLELVKEALCGKTWVPLDNPDVQGALLGYIDSTTLPVGNNIIIYQNPDFVDSTRLFVDSQLLPYVGIVLPTGGTYNPNNLVEYVINLSNQSVILNWYSCQQQPTPTPSVTPTSTPSLVTPTPTPSYVPIVNCNNYVHLNIITVGKLKYFSCLMNDYVETVITIPGEFIIEECCLLQSITGLNGLTYTITNNGIDCSGLWKDQGITYSFPDILWGTFDPVEPTPTPTPSITPTHTVTPTGTPLPTPTMTPSPSSNVGAPMYRISYVTSKINPAPQSYGIDLHGSFNKSGNYFNFNYTGYTVNITGPRTITYNTNYTPLLVYGDNMTLNVYETITRLNILPTTSSTSRVCKIYINDILVNEVDYNTIIKLTYLPLEQPFENITLPTINKGDLITIEINNIFT